MRNESIGREGFRVSAEGIRWGGSRRQEADSAARAETLGKARPGFSVGLISQGGGAGRARDQWRAITRKAILLEEADWPQAYYDLTPETAREYAAGYEKIIRGEDPEWALAEFRVYVGSLDLIYMREDGRVLALRIYKPTRLGLKITDGNTASYEISITHRNSQHIETTVIEMRTEDGRKVRRRREFQLHYAKDPTSGYMTISEI